MKAILTLDNLASGLVTTIWTPVFVAIFFAIIAYAFWPRNKAAFDEAKGQPHQVAITAGDALTMLAGQQEAFSGLREGPDASVAKAMEFGKGGKGLKLIWAAFVLDQHGVETWTLHDHKASVGIRIPLVTA